MSRMWSWTCQLLNVNCHLSTAHHPETDGSTERLNAIVEFFLRVHCNYLQDDWANLLVPCEFALNNQKSSSLGLSPFFMTHGYEYETIKLPDALFPSPLSRSNPVTPGEEIAKKFVELQEFAQSMLAHAQQEQEKYANQHRSAAPVYSPSGLVWLDMCFIKNPDRPSWKLDHKYERFTVLEPVGIHAYCLDTPSSLHDVFHTWLLRLGREGLLPGQKLSPYNPPTAFVPDQTDNNGLPDEGTVEQIVGKRTTHKEN